ncbi:thymidylate kinase-domain-containing protein [Lasiosphaeria ovina]|uniref:Thymidylate kinase n=1 Tax=Lasiosphaeria ovina TaxID=92902 RepID=A0AAE0N7Z4_9PEZI|nr:thymidylate kinase-domain-containing protein [Lasiosphaeria ovina]
MASINDLATAASAVSALAPPPYTTSSTASSGPSPAAAGEVPSSGAAVVRGALVVLEGLDRSGKTTQVKLLEQRFVELGRRVKVMRFPDRTTPIGQMIDGYLKSQVEMDDHAIHLLFTTNRWEAAKTIVALLNSGVTVVCDRYYHSGIVYSAAKQNPALSLTWARAPEIGLPRPDLVLFLDLDEAQARGRGGWGGEVYEKGEMQRRVRELFWGLSMGKINTVPVSVAGSAAGGGPSAPAAGEAAVAVGPPTPETLTGTEQLFRQEEEDLYVIDASPSVEEVAEEVWRVVKIRVEAVENGEVGNIVRRVS